MYAEKPEQWEVNIEDRLYKTRVLIKVDEENVKAVENVPSENIV